jgi:hypothetical protein
MRYKALSLQALYMNQMLFCQTVYSLGGPCVSLFDLFNDVYKMHTASNYREIMNDELQRNVG